MHGDPESGAVGPRLHHRREIVVRTLAYAFDGEVSSHLLDGDLHHGCPGSPVGMVEVRRKP